MTGFYARHLLVFMMVALISSPSLFFDLAIIHDAKRRVDSIWPWSTRAIFVILTLSEIEIVVLNGMSLNLFAFLCRS